MTRLSTRTTFFHKKIFPVLWVGVLVFVTFSSARKNQSAGLSFLVAPGLLAACGFFLFKKLIWNLADAVYDCGDHLLVKLGRDEERVSLANIMNVNVTSFGSPRRITLKLHEPGKFGDEIVFMPTFGFTLNPFAKSEVAEDLIYRVDQARSTRARQFL